MSNDELRPLTKEEGEALTAELQAVLEKHNAELGVSSSIQLLRREAQPVPSPAEFIPDGPESETVEG